MIYSDEKVEIKVKKLLRIYKDLTMEDFFELIPQEMEIAYISGDASTTQQDRRDGVEAVMCGLINEANVDWADKKLLRQMVPNFVKTIDLASQQYYAINREDC